MKTMLLFLAACAALVAAQEPERCETPPEWHSHIFRGIRESETFTSYVGRFAYDAFNERFRFLEGLPEEHKPLYAHYFFHQEKCQLRVNFTTMNCTRSSLYEAFRPFNIPFDAKLVDVLEIGSNADPEAGVEVSVWEGDTDEGGHFTSVFTTKGCLPVSDDYKRGSYYYSTHRFYDVEAGYNPDDFDPPDFCPPCHTS